LIFSSHQNKIETKKEKQAEIVKQQVKPEPSKLNVKSFKVPILMYHYIRIVNDPNDKLGISLSVTPTEFDNQLRWLSENGYKTVGLDYLSNPIKLDFKPVVITFDDGYSDAYTDAYPILKKYNFSGVFYLITEKVGTPNYLDWDMAREMNKNGMFFGSHTTNHADLSKTKDSLLTREIKDSKEKIEKELGITVTDFCYPSGKFNEDTIAKVKEIGYKTAATTLEGIVNEKSDLFKLKRIRIKNDTSLQEVLNKVY
jgi:peptidoglycan/xylan/chitin deacetylase (PgdA/CDA1 family)